MHIAATTAAVDAAKKIPTDVNPSPASTSMAVADAHFALESHTTAADDMTKQGAQATAAFILTALPERTRSQPLNGSNNIGDECLLQISPPSSRASQTPRRSPTTPKENSPSSPHVSLKIMPSTFPSELPPRPLPKQSPFRRLCTLPKRPIQAAKTDKNPPNNHTSISRADIEMGSLGVRDEVQHHELQSLARVNRRLKIYVLALMGLILVMVGVMLIYVAYSYSAT